MSFESVRGDWEHLGEVDPLWAVYVAPDKRGNNWDESEFLSLGVRDVASARRWLGELGLNTSWSRVLDFGCGAGRLSQALAAHAEEVVGVDVSEPMLRTARRLDRQGRCRFVRSDHPDLRQFDDGEFDLVYSELVLQHLPADLIETYLGEFVRVLRPGGIAMVQCTVEPLPTARGLVWRALPQRLLGLVQTKVLGYPAPMLMTGMSADRVRTLVSAHGGEVVAERMRDQHEVHWRSGWYAIRRLAVDPEVA